MILKKIKPIFHPLIILILGVFLATAVTWPFAAKLSTYYQDSGDYAFDGTMLWYNQESIKTGKIFNQQEYFNGYQFYPQPTTIAYSDHLLASSIIFSPIYWLSGNFVFSVNLTTLLTLILSFVISFYCINYFVKNSFAAIIGAFVYSFNPQIFARFPYHIGLLSHYFLPLVFLLSYKFLTKPTFKNALYFNLAFTLNSLSAVYFQILSVLFLPFFSLPFLISHFLKKDISYFVKLLKAPVLFVLFLPVFLHFNFPYLQFSNDEQAVRKLEETFFFSGRIINWFFANPDSLVYGEFVKNFDKIRSPGPDYDGKFNYAEHTLFLNFLPLMLTVFGALYLWRKIKRKQVDYKGLLVLSAFLMILGASFLLSLGPYFFGFNGESPRIKLPFYYLYQVIPIMKGIRVPNRLQFIFYIPFSLFVAFGTYYFINKFSKKKWVFIIFTIIFALLLLENIHFRSYENKSTFFQNSAFIEGKLDFLKNKKVLHYPINIWELGETNTYTLNWQVMTGAYSLNGYSGYAPPDQLAFLIDLKKNFDQTALEKLQIIKTDYVVIHKDLLGKSDLFKEGTVYEDEKLQIVDLTKYNFNYKLCDFENDLTKDIKLVSARKFNGQFYAVILKNKSTCYLPSFYENKYRKIKFFTNFLGQTVEHTAFLRMPVLIAPNQEVILSEVEKNLKIQ